MPAVTISAGYGAGGSAIARAVAEQLGYPLLDRAISSQVAAQLQVSVAEAHDGTIKRSFAERFFGVLAPLAGGVTGTGADAELAGVLPVQEGELFRERAEAIVREALAEGAVVLGRGGAAALVAEPQVLRVRLYGPIHARIAHAMHAENIDAPAARKRLPEVDRARAHYVRRLYGVDIDDAALYHLQVDSTALPLLACAGLIVSAFRALLDSAPDATP